MVHPRSLGLPRRIETAVVRPVRRHRERHCIFCGATLASDRRDRDPWCSCHHGVSAAGSLDLRVLWLISAAWPCSVNVAKALDEDRDSVWRAVERWRSRGVRIVGLRSVGYRLGG
jgi:hypothetical protein